MGSHRRRENAHIEVDSDDASSVAGSERSSVLEETAQLTKARLEAQQAQIAAMEASAEAREAAWAAREQRFDEMAQRLESMSDAEHDMPQRPQRNVKGRGIGSYHSSRLRMDEDDGDDDK